MQPAVRVVEASRLVDRREHRELVDSAELEVLLSGARRDVDDAAALVQRDLVPRDDAMVDLSARAEVVERPAIPEPDELGALHGSDERLVRIARGRDPLSVLAQAVVGVGLDGRRDVRRQRPRRRRPDDERLARAGRGEGSGRTATDRSDPGRRRSASARAARSTCRSAGTTPSSGAPCRGSRART